MSERKRAKWKIGSGVSLNLILWFAFSVFALLLVVIFMAVQSLLVSNQYREQTLHPYSNNQNHTIN